MQAEEMHCGEVGVVIGRATERHTGILVMRMYDGLVSLDDPTSTWTGRILPGFMVRLVRAEVVVEQDSDLVPQELAGPVRRRVDI